MMKYVNTFTKYKVGIIPFNLVLILILILAIITENETSALFSMCIVFPIVMIVVDSLYFIFDYLMYSTYYDDKRIVQKLFRKIKEIQIDEINTIILTKNIIVLSKEDINDELPANIIRLCNKLKSNNIIFQLGDTDGILNVLQCVKCKVVMVKPMEYAKIRLKKYVDIKE